MKALRKLFWFIILAITPAVFAATTTLSATVTDSDSQAWANGTYVLTFVYNPAGGVPVVAGQAFTLTFSGTLDGTGSFSQVVTSTTGTTPATNPPASGWSLKVCPQMANTPCYSTTPLAVTGASQSITTQINAVIVAPRIAVNSLAGAYNDTEVPGVGGSQYFRVTDNTFRCFTTAWGSCGGTGTFNQLSGDAISGSTGGATEVVGLINHLLPSLTTGYLNWTGTAWALSTVTGGLTSFTTGNLSPLFTAALGANPTTAPALAFTASTAVQNSVLAGPATGGTGAYSFRALVSSDIPNNAANTSGSAGSLSAALSLSGLASQAANTVVGAIASGSPSALPMPSCSTAGSSALIWTTGTGFGCNSITGGSISFPQTVAGTTNSGGIPYFSSATVLTSSAVLAAGHLLLGGGAGAAPTSDANLDDSQTTANTLTYGGAGGIASAGGFASTGSTQGAFALGVGSGTVPTTLLPTAYNGWIGTTTGTQTYFQQMCAASPTAGQVMAFAVPGTVNGVTQSVCSWITPVTAFSGLTGNLGTTQGPSSLTGLLKDAAGSLSAATAGTDYVIPSGSISGTAANLSGTPALPNGVTATTQTAGDNSTKLATTAYTNITPTTVSTSGSPLTLTGVSGVYVNNSGGAFNWVVDAPVLGKTYCFTNYPGQTGVLTITSTTSVFIAYGGTNGTVTTGTLVSGGAKGDALCIEGLDSTHYSAFGAGFGVWINH